MVHKKSEYRLQFHLLGKDLRTKIWQDNITFRESCRKLNQADHYWTYQLTDEQCECENDEEEEDEATLPQHKLKHKILVAKYEKQKPQAEIEDVTEQIQDITRPIHINSLPEAQDIAIQTPNWKTQEQRDNEVPNSKVQAPEQNLNVSVHPVKEHEQIKKDQELVPSHISTRQNIKIQEPKSQQQLKRDFINEHQHSCTTGYLSDRSALTPSSRTPHFTKTSKKAYFEGKKSPFASFGWNDSDRDIGQKKTYNVYAPENEVYSPALLALKRRREAIEKYLTEEAERKRLELNSSAMGAVNHSSIWMSEYQDKFSQGRKFVPDRFYSRPKSAPSCHRSCGWRYS